MIFHNKDKTKRELTQIEREAIVDLLHLCLYADALISLREGEVLSDVVEVIGWETKSSFSSYEFRSIASARSARDSDASRNAFLEYAAERLQTKPSRELAIDLCKRLFSADGTTVEKESALLSEIRAILK